MDMGKTGRQTDTQMGATGGWIFGGKDEQTQRQKGETSRHRERQADT